MFIDEKVKYMDQKDVYDVIFKMFDQVIIVLYNIFFIV